MPSDYYARKLAGRRLQRCYELAGPRVSQYLEAEIRHVLGRLRPTDVVLELGCGYARVAGRLAVAARRVVGIDTARESLRLARALGSIGPIHLLCMNALELGFRDGAFDVVVCVQNGICAFGVDQRALLQESLRVLRPGGRLLVSTYSDRFWSHRLAWFQAQAAEGLLGPIDHAASRDGAIVCGDGFRSGRLTADQMRQLCSDLGLAAEIDEVDDSSVFCEVVKQKPRHGGGVSDV